MRYVIHVLFICMGNICRSPTAEGVFREKVRAAGLADRVTIDSAGTHDLSLIHIYMCIRDSHQAVAAQ